MSSKKLELRIESTYKNELLLSISQANKNSQLATLARLKQYIIGKLLAISENCR